MKMTKLFLSFLIGTALLMQLTSYAGWPKTASSYAKIVAGLAVAGCGVYCLPQTGQALVGCYDKISEWLCYTENSKYKAAVQLLAPVSLMYLGYKLMVRGYKSNFR